MDREMILKSILKNADRMLEEIEKGKTIRITNDEEEGFSIQVLEYEEII